MKKPKLNDPYLRVKVLTRTKRPNLACYLAMHVCYSEGSIIDELPKLQKLSEAELGRRVVEKCVKFGHWSVIEFPSITFAVEGYPHSVAMQVRTHRHLSIQVQSQRYTGERVLKADELRKDDPTASFTDCFQPIFYTRPVGRYTARNGIHYEVTDEAIEQDYYYMGVAAYQYSLRVKQGYSEESARDLLPQGIRQNFIVSFNPRSLLHFLDMRLPANAQLETRHMAWQVWKHFKKWMPEVAEAYESKRLGKNNLAP